MAREGTLERFSGDGIMVFFNDPVQVPDAPQRAARMALDMQREMAVLSPRWARRGYQLTMGVGIAQGFATIGGIGFEGRIDDGAVGNVTNLSARLCGEAKGGDILASARVVAALEDEFDIEAPTELVLKGLHKPVPVSRVLGR